MTLLPTTTLTILLTFTLPFLTPIIPHHDPNDNLIHNTPTERDITPSTSTATNDYTLCDDQRTTCRNGSSCRLEPTSEYSCDCTTIGDALLHFAGLECEYRETAHCRYGIQEDDESVMEHSFCVNEGKCGEMVGDSSGHTPCICKEGYEGDHCEYVTGKKPNKTTTTNSNKTPSKSKKRDMLELYGTGLLLMTILLVVTLNIVRQRRNERNQYEMREKVLATTEDLDIQDEFEMI